MEIKTTVFALFKELVEKYPVISVSGEAGTGKTSFTLYLIGNLLDFEGSCIWIQASEIFPRKRLITLFQDKKRQFLLENFYITPKNRIFNSYHDQYSLLKKIVDEDYIMPPEIRFIVVDNISHYLRLKFANIKDLKEKFILLDRFYDELLSPLILKCQRRQITLVLLHEVSFDLSAQRTRPFFHKLYKRIKGVNINLGKSFISKELVMEIVRGDQSISFPFTIKDNGFYF
jgi:RecA/RadA recombinase